MMGVEEGPGGISALFFPVDRLTRGEEDDPAQTHFVTSSVR